MSAIRWIAGISGNWNDAANWSSGTVPNGTQAATIDAPGTYTVTLSDSEAVNLFDMNSANATLSESTGGSLTVNTLFKLDTGTVVFRGANTIPNGITQDGGTLEIANAGALGAGAYALSGGEFIGLANETVATDFSLSGSPVIAAAHGKTVTLDNAGGWTITGPATITFGDPANDGTIVWGSGSGGTISNSFNLEIDGGVLKAADTGMSGMMTFATTTKVSAGATFDLNGIDINVSDLIGNGRVTNTATTGAASLGIGNASFHGIVTGNIALSVTAAGFVDLTGANTFTGGTTIGGLSAELRLGNGGTTGSVTGKIVDQGFLDIDHSNTFNLANHITGPGVLSQIGTGTTVIDHANTYSGGTEIIAGTLSIDEADAIGTGNLALFGGRLLATANLSLNNALLFNGGTAGLEVANGRTLTVHSAWTVSSGANVVFGSAADTGTILWADSAPGTETPGTYDVNLAGGTLEPRASTSFLGVLLANASLVHIAAGATLDVHGYSDILEAKNVTGGGTIANSGAASSFSFDGTGTNFSGTINGDLNVDLNFDAVAVLSGDSTYTGGTDIASGAVLALGNGGSGGSIKGAIDIAAGGTLIVDHGDTFNFANHLTGGGALEVFGQGTTVIHHANSFSGGTLVDGSTLNIDRAGAVGTGSLSLHNGALIASDTFTFDDALTLDGDVEIAAKHGQTLRLNNGAGLDITGGAATHLTFGDAGNNGHVVFKTTGMTVNAGYGVTVAGGTLAAGDSGFGTFIAKSSGVLTIDSGATLNITDNNIDLTALHGRGTLTGASGGSVGISSGTFAGAINGDLFVTISGHVTLTGGGNFTGGARLENGSTLTLANAAGEDVRFVGTSHLVLDAPNQFTGTIRGFSGADTIDLTNIAHNSHFHLRFKQHKLTVTDGTHTDVIHFAGSYETVDFSAHGDGHGGTIITDPPLHDSAMNEALAAHALEWFHAHAQHTDGIG